MERSLNNLSIKYLIKRRESLLGDNSEIIAGSIWAPFCKIMNLAMTSPVQHHSWLIWGSAGLTRVRPLRAGASSEQGK